MGAEIKAANKVTDVKGKIKKKAGQATDDAGLEAEGRAEESKATSIRLAKSQGRIQEMTRPDGERPANQTCPKEVCA